MAPVLQLVERPSLANPDIGHKTLRYARNYMNEANSRYSYFTDNVWDMETVIHRDIARRKKKLVLDGWLPLAI